MKTLTRSTATAAVAASLAAGVLAAAPSAGAAAPASAPANLYGSTFALQNYFAAFGSLAPFFDRTQGRVLPGVETGGDYIYDVDIDRDTISLSWNTAPEWDVYEPYVGAIGGLPQDVAASLPLADEHWITFGTDITGLRFSVDPSSTLQPVLRVEGTRTLVVSIPAGAPIGDGHDALIRVTRTR